MNLRFVAFVMLAAFLPLPAAASSIAVTGLWSRPATGTGVVYVTISNASSKPDALIAAASPLAKDVELHESTPVAMQGMPGMSGTSMHRVAAIPIPAHGVTRLRPGGYHIMLIGLRRDLGAGTRVPITLRFRSGAVIRAVATVRLTQ